MTFVSGEHVVSAVGEMTRLLAPYNEADWQVRAQSSGAVGKPRRTSRTVLSKYAAQFASGETTSYLPFDLVVRPSPPRRARRDHGVRPPAGDRGRRRQFRFGGVALRHVRRRRVRGDGCRQTLVHTHDIAQGLGVEWRPPDALSQLVVGRLLLPPPPGRASDVLLWATGRADLEGHPRVGEWISASGSPIT